MTITITEVIKKRDSTESYLKISSIALNAKYLTTPQNTTRCEKDVDTDIFNTYFSIALRTVHFPSLPAGEIGQSGFHFFCHEINLIIKLNISKLVD